MLKSQISLIWAVARCCEVFLSKALIFFSVQLECWREGQATCVAQGDRFLCASVTFQQASGFCSYCIEPPPQSHTMLAAFNIPGCQHSYYSRVLTWKCRCRLETPHLKEPVPIPKPHLELSGCDSASGIEVQGHHHGKAGGPTTVASGHTAKGPKDSEGSPELLHCQETEGRCHLCLKWGNLSRDPSWSSFPEVGSLVSRQLGFELQLLHEFQQLPQP